MDAVATWLGDDVARDHVTAAISTKSRTGSCMLRLRSSNDTDLFSNSTVSHHENDTPKPLVSAASPQTLYRKA